MVSRPYFNKKLCEMSVCLKDAGILITALPHTGSFYGKGVWASPHKAKYLHAEKSELIINKSGWVWEAVGSTLPPQNSQLYGTHVAPELH